MSQLLLATWFDKKNVVADSAPQAATQYVVFSGAKADAFVRHQATEEVKQPSHAERLLFYKAAAALSSGTSIQRHQQVRLVAAERDRPTVQNYAAMFFGRVAAVAAVVAQPFWIFPATAAPQQQQEEIRQPQHGSRLLFGRTAPATPTASQPFWLWEKSKSDSASELIRGQDHDAALYPFRPHQAVVPTLVDGTSIQRHLQIRITAVEHINQRQDYSSALMFRKAATVTPTTAQPFWMLGRTQVLSGIDPPEDIVSVGHFIYVIDATTVSSVGQSMYLWPRVVGKPFPDELIHGTDHDAALYPFRPHQAVVPTLVDGTTIQRHQQTRITTVEVINRQPDHSNGVMFWRSQTPAVISQPWYIWQPTRVTLDYESIQQASHSLQAYRQKFIPVSPGQPWPFWKPVIGTPTPEESMYRENHDLALYPFRPHDALPPIPPAPDVTENTAGRITHIALPQVRRAETEAEKHARRVRQGTLKAEVAKKTGEPEAALVDESARVRRAVADIQAQSQQIREEIQRLEAQAARIASARKQAEIARAISLGMQELAMRELQVAVLQEEMEVIDLAFIICIALTLNS